MGIDLKQSRAGKFDRNKWFKAVYDEKNKLTPGADVCGIFYSTDKVSMSVNSIVYAGNIKKKEYVITIETNDNVCDLAIDDYVLYGGDMWIVDNVIAHDLNKNKEFSKRPSFTTEIKMRR